MSPASGQLAANVMHFARLLRESQSVDQRSGVSARVAIAAAETVAASARHRGARATGGPRLRA